MTCRSYRETLFDIARGVALPAAVARAAEAHAAGCCACRIDLERQRELTTVLGDLRDEASRWSASGDLEQGLLQSIAAGPPASRRFAPARRVMPLWSAAAAAVLVASVWLGVRGGTDGAPVPQQSATVNHPGAAEPPGVAEVKAAPRRADAPASREPFSGPAQRTRGHAATARRDEGAGTMEFLSIPGAVGLPPMESARIVRTEVPVSALPAYGVAIVPDAVRSAVPADLLIGQDGRARGIRLVSARQE